MFTMWTVGSNPTLSVENRENGTGTKGAPDMTWSDLANPVRPFGAALRSTKFGAVAQLGERQNRNLEVGGSIPLCSTRDDMTGESIRRNSQRIAHVVPQHRLGTNTVVLDGELAVPCDPQSATAGSNSHPKDRTCVVGMRYNRY